MASNRRWTELAISESSAFRRSAYLAPQIGRAARAVRIALGQLGPMETEIPIRATRGGSPLYAMEALTSPVSISFPFCGFPSYPATSCGAMNASWVPAVRRLIYSFIKQRSSLTSSLKRAGGDSNATLNPLPSHSGGHKLNAQLTFLDRPGLPSAPPSVSAR